MVILNVVKLSVIVLNVMVPMVVLTFLTFLAFAALISRCIVLKQKVKSREGFLLLSGALQGF
jgi:hypothetical protein